MVGYIDTFLVAGIIAFAMIPSVLSFRERKAG